MKVETKIELLKLPLRTKELVIQLPELEANLAKALIDESLFRNQHHGYLASSGSDCQEVKRLLAEISIDNPGKNAAERDAWSLRQRVENQAVNDAITKQREVAFVLDDYRIKVEMAKRKYESVKVVLNLRTAQINFLAED